MSSIHLLVDLFSFGSCLILTLDGFYQVLLFGYHPIHESMISWFGSILGIRFGLFPYLSSSIFA